jgi:hypothetical protein
MRRSVILLVLVLAVLVVSPAAADEYPFAIRFGLNLLEPTADSTIEDTRIEFDTQSGAEFSFEWYFLSKLGLEADVIGASDIDVNDDSDNIDALTFTTVTLGLNGHVIRTEGVDWAIGLLGGRAWYGDFERTDGVSTFSSENDTIWGVQTFLDIPIRKGGSWGINVGVKWLDTGLDTELGTIDYDPFIGRVMGVWRWGNPR